MRIRIRSSFPLAALAPVGLTLLITASHRPPRAPACDPGNAGLTVPAGFCATLFADVAGIRHLAVAPNGDVFASGGKSGVTALRDRKHDGHADTTVTFGSGSGTGIALGSDAIYYAPNDRVIRFNWRPGSLVPSDQGTVIVSGLPTGGHTAKTLALSRDGAYIFVDHGSGSNSCQEADRMGRSPGKQPCPELPTRAGTWRYDSRKPNQTIADGEHWTTGVRNGMAIAVDPSTGELWGATHGRDQLGDWGMTPQENAEKPAEEFGLFNKGADYGWPYCYYDPLTHKKVQAPEYGGDGTRQGDCASRTQPAIAFPAHWAPLQLAFVPARNEFGPGYESGAFLAFHGSWNRAPLPQDGFRVVFIPFRAGKPVGNYSTFAQGNGTQIKISAVAFAPDGSALYIGSDQAGKIWRVVRNSGR